jgi:hypothetical protein
LESVSEKTQSYYGIILFSFSLTRWQGLVNRAWRLDVARLFYTTGEEGGGCGGGTIRPN